MSGKQAQVDPLTSAIEAATAELADQQARHEEFMIRMRAESAADWEIRGRFLEHARRATAEDYAGWLVGYLRNGGAISHVYDYDLPSDFFVLTSRPGSVPALYGAAAVHVIVPADITPGSVSKQFHGKPGHGSLMYMRDYSLVGGWVPVCRDVLDILRGAVSTDTAGPRVARKRTGETR